MDPLSTSERSVLRWGGAAGIVGAALLLSTFVIVGVFVGAAVLPPEQQVARFPDIRWARIAENGLYLAALALWLVHATAIERITRAGAAGAAMAGRTFVTLGSAMLAAGALPHVASMPLSDLYIAASGDLAERETVAFLWQTMMGVFDALLVTGLLLLPLGVVALGLAMRRSPLYGARAGMVAMGLGVVGFAAGLACLVEVSEVAALAFFSLIAFNAGFGWRMFQGSRVPGAAPAQTRTLREGWSAS